MSLSWPVAELSEDMPYLLLDVLCIIMMNEGDRVNGQIVTRMPAASANSPPSRFQALARPFRLIRSSAVTSAQEYRDGCPPRPCFARLDIWRTPTDSYSTSSAGRRSSNRRSLRSFSASRTPRYTEALTGLLAEGIIGRVSHGTAGPAVEPEIPPDGQRHRRDGLDARLATPSDFVRAYPMSREWLTLLIRRMDPVASVYRLASSMSPGIDGLRSQVEFHRRGRFDATITLHDGRDFGVVRQGFALRRRSLYDRLRAIAEYDYTRRPGTVLVLVPSVWEERLTTRFCEDLNIRDCYVAVESRDALERRGLRLWCCTS